MLVASSNRFVVSILNILLDKIVASIYEGLIITNGCYLPRYAYAKSS